MRWRGRLRSFALCRVSWVRSGYHESKEATMATSAAGLAGPRTLLIARILGYLVFLAAFFLPAVRQVTTPGAGVPEVYKGWFCAWITIINTLNRESWQSKESLAILSGWINPLMLLYVGFLFSRRLRTARRVIAVIILLFMIATWTYFALAPLVPLIGHVLWIVGILLIVAGDFVPRKSAATLN
jgi:hypothetical protein